MNSKAYIYEIKNKINGHRYIGSTVNFKSRWANHKTTLRGKRHHSFVLQKAWDTYGENNFEFNLLLVCSEKDRLDYETRCMKLQSYNILRTPLATPIRRDWVRTPEVCAKISAGIKQTLSCQERRSQIGARISKANTGRKKTKSEIEKSAHAKWKPVFCKELGITFLNQIYAAEYLNIARSTVTESIKRNRKIKGKVKGEYFTLVRVA
jgi:group I intron endonuclease